MSTQTETLFGELTTAREIARARGVTMTAVYKQAGREGWAQQLAGEHVYRVRDLDPETRAAVISHRQGELTDMAVARVTDPPALAYRYRDRVLTAKDFTAAELAVAEQRADFLVAVRLYARRNRLTLQEAVGAVIRDTEAAALRGEFPYPTLHNPGAGRYQLTEKNYFNWSKRWAPWQRDPFDRGHAYVLADLYRIAAEWHKETELDRLALSEAETRAIQFLVLETDSVPVALELYARDRRCRDSVRAAIHRYTETGNIPDSLRRAIYVPAEAKQAYRDKRAFRRSFLQYRGNFYINRLGEKCEFRAGDIWEADDMTVNQPWWVEWPFGGDPCSERYGVRVGRGQLLALRDAKSGRWLSFTLLMRWHESYRGSDIWRWLGRTVRDTGLPRVGFRFERGSWESKQIEGVKLFADDGTHEARFGGLQEVTNLVHAHGSKGKASIEQGFDMLQKVLAANSVHVGRHRGEFAEATRKLLACQDGRLDPRAAGFLSMDELVERIAGAMHFLNTRKINGRIQNGVPDEEWAKCVTADRPLPALAAEKEWIFLPERRELTVRHGLVTATKAEYGTLYPFQITPFVERGVGEGFRVICSFDPAEPERGAWLFNNETRAMNVNNWKPGQFIGVAPLLELAPQLDLSESPASQGEARKKYTHAFRETYCHLGVFGRGNRTVTQIADGRGNQVVRTQQEAGGRSQEAEPPARAGREPLAFPPRRVREFDAAALQSEGDRLEADLAEELNTI